MDTPIKFTVIVPTKQRQDTLVHCLRTVVAQDYEDLTIIVSDNVSQDDTKQVVGSFHDPRIKYINTGRRLSMAHNYEFALSHVKDGWVTILGDDDGLLPGALKKVARVIGKTGCQAVMSNLCSYNWPSVPLNGGLLGVPLTKGFEVRNARVWLALVMQDRASYLQLPYLYTGGFIDTKIINKARFPDGHFYSSINPDAYSTLAFACVLDNYVMLKEPVAVQGTSSHSIGASWIGATKKEASQQFFSEDVIPFHPKVRSKNWPKDWPKSSPLHLYECYLQTEHLHQDFLKLKMDDQLALSLSRCPREWYDDLRKYCLEIAQLNGIDGAIVERKEKDHRKGEFYRHWKGIIKRGLTHLFLPGPEFGLHNVYDASMVAGTVFLTQTQYSHWLLRKIMRRIQKVLGNP